MTTSADRVRCGYRIQHSDNLFTDRMGAYRVSKGDRSNIFGAGFFEDIDASFDDEAFAGFMGRALELDFPHPFMIDVDVSPLTRLDAGE